MEQTASAKPPQRRRHWLRWIGLALALALVPILASTRLAAFGGRLKGERLARVKRSPNFADGRFQNPVPTATIAPGMWWQAIRGNIGLPGNRVPSQPIAISHRTTADYAAPPASGLRATWMGHATVLLEIDGRRIVLDPMWSNRGSPSTLVGPQRFFEPPISIEELPPIDAVVISHDHFDHLDMRSILRLNARPVVFVVPLGVGADLEAWGVAAERIIELDWGEKTTLGGLELIAQPARHYSGRALIDNNRTLWASWLILGPKHRVFFSGDTGYLPVFKDIGEKFGPFDLTLIKIGAYGVEWPDIHIDPEQAVQVHADVRGRLMIPVHWGTLNIAFHSFSEPAERLMVAARAHHTAVSIPIPGQQVDVSAPPPLFPWWLSH